MPVPGGRWLGPQSVEDVARHLWCKGHENPYGNDLAPVYKTKERTPQAWGAAPDWLAKRANVLPTFPPLACYQGNAGDMGLPDDMSGWIVYLDPPYFQTSGYPFGTLGRSEVLRLAKEWHDRGAIVAISEAEPLPLDGWHHVQIDHARKGQKRTFSKQQSEWLTISRAPCHVPAKQMGMFGGGK
jgi:hypothetical protein